MTAYARLESRFARITLLRDAAGMLHWDAATLMPEGGAESRAEQQAAIEAVCHEMLTAPDLPDLLAAAREEDLDDWRRANLGRMQRQWVHAAGVEVRLVEAFTRATAACERVWRTARGENDFAAVRPRLEEVLALVREIAAAKAATLGCSPYEALLDQFEPGGSCAEIDRVFGRLEADLPPLIEAALEAQAARPPAVLPAGPFPVAAQRALGVRMMEILGFDFRHGRLDVSHHPFCGGTPDDIRITTRYDEADFTRALMGVIHETGHALYERGLPPAWRTQPVGRAGGMSLHESQSLLMEMQASRSRAFLTFAAPLIRDAFGAASGDPAWSVDNLVRLYTRVSRSLIRVDADEVTYPAHVILRTRLERSMIAGELSVTDLPGAWREGMERLLGVTPPDDRDGCLQDIHWFDGAFGYFPTYTLGAIAAAQLFDAARRAEPALMAGLERGDFAPLVGWMRREVHGQGARLTTDALLTQATGRGLDVETYLAHLRGRYLA